MVAARLLLLLRSGLLADRRLQHLGVAVRSEHAKSAAAQPCPPGPWAGSLVAKQAGRLKLEPPSILLRLGGTHQAALPAL